MKPLFFLAVPFRAFVATPSGASVLWQGFSFFLVQNMASRTPHEASRNVQQWVEWAHGQGFKEMTETFLSLISLFHLL